MTFDPNLDLPRNLYAPRVRDRAVHEMLGLVKGIVCDGVISDDECAAFRRWLQANPDATASWPGKILAERIVGIYEDGVIDIHERHELYELFCDTVGDGGTEEALSQNYSTRLPFDDPVPTIVFDNQTFVLTGAFIYGTRQRCEREIAGRGGRCRPTIVKQPLTLVVGTIGSDAWIQSDFGRKIETAVRHREVGIPIKIVSEESWTEALSA